MCDNLTHLDLNTMEFVAPTLTEYEYVSGHQHVNIFKYICFSLSSLHVNMRSIKLKYFINIVIYNY